MINLQGVLDEIRMKAARAEEKLKHVSNVEPLEVQGGITPQHFC